MTIEHSPRQVTVQHLGEQLRGVARRLLELAQNPATASPTAKEAGKQAMLKEADRLKKQPKT